MSETIYKLDVAECRAGARGCSLAAGGFENIQSREALISVIALERYAAYARRLEQGALRGIRCWR
jgi:hypothetical protein